MVAYKKDALQFSLFFSGKSMLVSDSNSTRMPYCEVEHGFYFEAIQHDSNTKVEIAAFQTLWIASS